jgi:hypothetical protein
LNAPRVCPTLVVMSKSKKPGTGEGYLGETMVHRTTRAVGLVTDVVEARDGWAPQLTLRLPDGSIKKGKLGEFREPTASERKIIPPA